MVGSEAKQPSKQQGIATSITGNDQAPNRGRRPGIRELRGIDGLRAGLKLRLMWDRHGIPDAIDGIRAWFRGILAWHRETGPSNGGMQTPTSGTARRLTGSARPIAGQAGKLVGSPGSAVAISITESGPPRFFQVRRRADLSPRIGRGAGCPAPLLRSRLPLDPPPPGK
jgi:hypothetical protein